MAKNKMKGVVEVELGGANRFIKFDFNSICELEAYFDKPATKIFDTKRGIAMREIRGTMWIGLQRFHNGAEIDEVGDWLQEALEEGRFEDVSSRLGEALGLALRGPDEEDPGKNPEPSKEGAKQKKGSTSRNSSNKPDVSV